MAKTSGIGWTTLTVTDAGAVARDIRNDITQMDFTTPYGNADITGSDKSAMERLALLADLKGSMTFVFNPAANRAHAVFSGDLRVARTWAIGVGGVTLSAVVLLTEYGLSRNANGELGGKVPFVLSDGTVPTWA